MLVGQQHRAAQQAAMHRQTLQQLRIDTLAAQKQVILPPRPSRAYITPRVAKSDKPIPWHWYRMETGQLYTASNAWRIPLDPWLDFTFVVSLSGFANNRALGAQILTEEQKQLVFKNSSTLGAGILLDEFAWGTGPEHRLFTPGRDQMARDFLTGYVLDDIRNGLYEQAKIKKMTYDEFKKTTVSISYGLAFSPDHTKTYMESLGKHLVSNPLQMFVAGAIIRSCPSTAPGNYIEVEILNQTSRRSVMLHLGDNYKRHNLPIGERSLSTIHQRFRFRLSIDPNRFPKR